MQYRYGLLFSRIYLHIIGICIFFFRTGEFSLSPPAPGGSKVVIFHTTNLRATIIISESLVRVQNYSANTSHVRQVFFSVVIITTANIRRVLIWSDVHVFVFFCFPSIGTWRTPVQYIIQSADWFRDTSRLGVSARNAARHNTVFYARYKTESAGGRARRKATSPFVIIHTVRVRKIRCRTRTCVVPLPSGAPRRPDAILLLR